MTEFDWLACTHEDDLYNDLLICGLTPRKLLLLATAYLRRVWLLIDETTRLAADAGESYADGLLSREDLLAIWTNAEYDVAEALWLGPNAAYSARSWCPCCYEHEDADWKELRVPSTGVREAEKSPEWVATRAAFHSRSLVEWAASPKERSARSAAESRIQYHLLRDVLGPSSSKPPLQRAHYRKNTTVQKMAALIYSRHAFGDLLILADALEDAGCGNADILSHCRSPGPHVRGCWVVDLILGKE